MRGKYYLLVFVVIIALTGLTMTDSSAQYLCGDANADEIVNVSDAVYMINYVFIFGSPAPDPLCTGDANYDSDVNVSDAVYLINYVFVFGSPPPVPNCCDICPTTVTDYDGNVYQTLLIGDQCWMMKNLEVIHYRNGDPIPNVADSSAWQALSTGAYCSYNNDEGNVATYGRLYNWYAVDDGRNIAPEGWHVPSDAEWKQLEMYLGMSQAEADASSWRGTDEGGKLKEAGTVHWLPPNEGATNETGFTALPGGFRLGAAFGYMGTYGPLWTSTVYSESEAWCRDLFYAHGDIYRGSSFKRNGFSVRCVKDPID
jgi:uncharacterized protein (TIGR02145 family)